MRQRQDIGKHLAGWQDERWQDRHATSAGCCENDLLSVGAVATVCEIEAGIGRREALLQQSSQGQGRFSGKMMAIAINAPQM